MHSQTTSNIWITILNRIITDILTTLYQSFWFSLLLTIFIMFFYLYAYEPMNGGRGAKEACRAWIGSFKASLSFRKIFCLVFYTAMILFRTLFSRKLWMNPLSDVMGGWWIWVIAFNGKTSLTTECFENIILLLPFTILLMWTAKEQLILKRRGGKGVHRICFASIVGRSAEISFLFSLSIELFQLFLRLGTFQLSDLFYNTIGGAAGGLIYWIGWKVNQRMRK